MEICPVDLADDELMHQVFEVNDRAQMLGREHASRKSEREVVANLRSPDQGEHVDLVVARLPGDPGRPGRVVGTAIAYVFLLDNLDKAWLEVHVDPAYARRGIGSALLEHVSRLATDQGRTLLMLDATIPVDQVEDHGYRRFAERHGFTYSNVEVVRHAPVPVPDATLDAWAARAAEAAQGYTLRTLVDEMPPEIAPGLGTLIGQLGVDAPTGAVDFEEEVVTPERLQERLATVRAMGRILYETLALSADGTVAAQTTLVVPTNAGTDTGTGVSTEAWQWGTFVHREHRGHRLGLAVKTANLRAVQDAHPGLRRLSTQNAETNEWMIAINELMGFLPVECSVELVQRVRRGL